MKATLGNTVGAAFLGLVAASILFGVTAIQVYIYYHNYPKDWRLQKITVGLLLLLDAFHLSLTVHVVYHYLITNFGDLEAQKDVVWSFKLQIVINIIIVLVVQGLYGIRIYKLGKNFSKIWPIFTSFIILGGYIVGILLAVETYKADTFAAIHKMTWIIFTSFAIATAIDIVIAMAICYYLNRSTSYMFDRTNSKIFTIMKYVIISGFATSACSLSALIALATMPDTLVFLGIEFLLTKLYINSYIALLNARNHLRDKEYSRSMSISKMINIQSGVTRGDGEDDYRLDSIESPNKNSSLSPTPFLNSSDRSDYGSRRGSKAHPSEVHQTQSHLGIVVHTTQERTYDEDIERGAPRAV
ncbi:hypothetical protein BJ165DRAFT_1535351 [Panaeolus papilionaceus]|nr:hypothetical protein BJ165DRAFT_1535351 [Panaeolus papilionaceus]